MNQTLIYMHYIDAYLRFSAFDPRTFTGLDPLRYFPGYFESLITFLFWAFVYISSTNG